MCSNDDPRMIYDLFMTRSELRLYTFVWENVEKSFSQNALKDSG